MEYLSERITNIKELEKIIEECKINIQFLEKETKKENPSIKIINEFSEKLKKDYLKIVDFEFQIDIRKVNYCE